MVLDNKCFEKVDESAILARQLIMGDEIDNSKIFEKVMAYGVGIFLVESEDYDAFSKIENNKPIIYLNKTLDESRRIYATAYELGMIFLGAASKWLVTREYPSTSKSLVHIYYKNKDPKIQQDDDKVAERFANVFLFKAAELSKNEIEEKLKFSAKEFYNHSIEIGGPVATGWITIYNNSSSPDETASELKKLKKAETASKLKKTKKAEIASELKIIEKVEKSKENYREIFWKEKARRQTLVNDWIDDLTPPLLSELTAKNKYRPWVLSVFAICAAFLIGWIIFEINSLQRGGLTNNEMLTIKFLLTVFFADTIGLIVIIFKYLFDKNNSSFTGLNDLVAKAIQYEKENDGK